MCFDLIETKPRAYEQEDTKSVQLSLNCSVWRGLVCCVLFLFIIHMLQTKSHSQRKTRLSLFSRANPVAASALLITGQSSIILSLHVLPLQLVICWCSPSQLHMYHPAPLGLEAFPGLSRPWHK